MTILLEVYHHTLRFAPADLLPQAQHPALRTLIHAYCGAVLLPEEQPLPHAGVAKILSSGVIMGGPALPEGEAYLFAIQESEVKLLSVLTQTGWEMVADLAPWPSPPAEQWQTACVTFSDDGIHWSGCPERWQPALLSEAMLHFALHAPEPETEWEFYLAQLELPHTLGRWLRPTGWYGAASPAQAVSRQQMLKRWRQKASDYAALLKVQCLFYESADPAQPNMLYTRGHRDAVRLSGQWWTWGEEGFCVTDPSTLPFSQIPLHVVGCVGQRIYHPVPGRLTAQLPSSMS